MSRGAWLLPNDDPLGPWLRVKPLLKGFSAQLRPLVLFRMEPSAKTREVLGKMEVDFCVLGRRGSNRVSCAWRLGKLLRSEKFGELIVWDVQELPYALLAAPRNLGVSCELERAQQKPGYLKWLPVVRRWFRRGVVGPDAPGEIPVPYLFPGTPEEATVRISSGGGAKAKILLLADNRQTVRDGLWGFDIFRHAWPGSTLKVVGCPEVLEAARNFAKVLGLGDSVSYQGEWPRREEMTDGFWMIVLLGTGPWQGDSCLRARTLGCPVLAQENETSSALHAKKIIEGVVRQGDRAGLAATLQATFQNPVALGNIENYCPGASELGGFSLEKVISAYNFQNGS